MAKDDPYEFKYLDEDQAAAIGEQAVAAAAADEPAAPQVDESLLRAWEQDLAAHRALRDAATDDDKRAEHDTAIATLEKALKEHAK
jgi:hypothetical protein